MRRAHRLLAGLAAAFLTTGAAGADVVSRKPDSVELTAYRTGGEAENWDEYWEDWDEDGLDSRDGLVLVSETRTIDVPAGRAKISFRGVAEGIVPQTAIIEGLASPMLERNHDYDLLSPAALIDKSVGRRVTLVRTNRIDGKVTEESALVRSGPQGTVLDYGDGRVEAVGCSGWPERLVFEEAPEGLADTPTLSIVTDAPQAGRHQVRLTYLAFGLKWGADYVARIHPGEDKLDLLAWITLSNRSGFSFVNAKTQVLAGEVERDSDTEPSEPRMPVRTPKCWPLDTTTHGKRPAPPPKYAPAPAPYYGDGDVEALIVTAQKREEVFQDVPIAISAVEGDLADYKVYALPEPTTVAARQTKQVMMFHKPDLPFERVYVGRLENTGEEVRAAHLVLRLENRRGSPLGRALPAGRVRVTQTYGSGLLLAGEEAIGDTAVGRPVELLIGEAAGVELTTTELGSGDIRRGEEIYTRSRYETVVANRLAQPITVELRFRNWRYSQLVRASRPRRERDGEFVWTLKLKPGQEKALRYTVE